MSDINQENPNLNDENEDSQAVDGKKKLTDTQLRIIQAIAGFICAIALVVSLYVPSIMVQEKRLAQDSLLNYIFVVVFLVIMFGRRKIENKYRLRLGMFSLAMIDGIVLGVMIYVVRILYAPETQMADVFKILIIVGVVLLTLVLGVLMPYLRYRKRVAEGTVIPIRIPEKKEPEHTETEEEPEVDGSSSIEQKVAAMLREIEETPESQPQLTADSGQETEDSGNSDKTE